MKQNISIEQVKELNVNQLNKLIKELHMPKYYIQAVNCTLIYEENVIKDISEYLTVGRLMEELSGQCDCVDCIKRMINEISFYGIDFCDALWNTLKSRMLS